MSEDERTLGLAIAAGLEAASNALHDGLSVAGALGMAAGAMYAILTPSVANAVPPTGGGT